MGDGADPVGVFPVRGGARALIGLSHPEVESGMEEGRRSIGVRAP